MCESKTNTIILFFRLKQNRNLINHALNYNRRESTKKYTKFNIVSITSIIKINL